MVLFRPARCLPKSIPGEVIREEEPEELEEELGEPAGRDSRNPRSCWAGLGCAGLVSAGLGFYFLCTSFAFPFIFPRQVKGQ